MQTGVQKQKNRNLIENIIYSKGDIYTDVTMSHNNHITKKVTVVAALHIADVTLEHPGLPKNTWTCIIVIVLIFFAKQPYVEEPR